MLNTTLSVAFHGLDITVVRVEVDISNGLPMLQMVGSLSGTVKEAGDRVKTAIKNLGYELKPKKIIVSMSPGNIRKTGTSYDLAIAVAMLAGYGIINQEKITETLIIGEVGLDGKIYPINGALIAVVEGMKKGIRNYVMSIENSKECSIIEGANIYGIGRLSEGIKHFNSGNIKKVEKQGLFPQNEEKSCIDFADIRGKNQLKRVAEIAVSGHHNLLMIGPPGAGKTMVAKAIASILPSLTLEESIEISKIYSALGLLHEKKTFLLERPFRSIHHTTSKVAIIGGGAYALPGEISLAHGGVLFLDELLEFPQNVLEVLRQPIEEKKIKIMRNRAIHEYPANFMLVAAMNPCPCGNYPDLNKCNCTQYQVKRYINKLSQPILDRIDLCVNVERVDYKELEEGKEAETSLEIQKRVEKARAIQKKRFENTGILSNAMIPSNEIKTYCELDAEGQKFMKEAYTRWNLSARKYYKIIRVARTIADLNDMNKIELKHLYEAASYKLIDTRDWGQ